MKKKLPKGCVFRLPTEAEWEYALNASADDGDDPYVRCREGQLNNASKIVVPLDDAVSRYKPKVDWNWVAGVDVGTRMANHWGFYDMLGNGPEITFDRVDSALENPLQYADEENDPFRWFGDSNCNWVFRNHSGEGHSFDWSWWQRGFRSSVGKRGTFYTTSNFDQAAEFAKKVVDRNKGAGVPTVTTFSFDEDAALAVFNVRRFAAPTDDWLDFVVDNRRNKYVGPSYDLKIGPVANDNVYRTIQLIVQRQGVGEAEATRRFYSSELYARLSDEKLKLWHYSAETLYALYDEEVRLGKITFPEEAC